MNDYIELGSITAFFGVQGWVKIHSHTRPRDGIAKYKQFFAGDNKQPITFTAIKSSGKHIIGHVQGIDSREDALILLGQTLWVKHDALPELENEYYWHELIGLTVINQHGVTLGTIIEMMETGANDVMVIRSTNNEEILIPYARSHFVVSIDIAKGEMQVDWEIDDGEDS